MGVVGTMEQLYMMCYLVTLLLKDILENIFYMYVIYINLYIIIIALSIYIVPHYNQLCHSCLKLYVLPLDITIVYKYECIIGVFDNLKGGDVKYTHL